MNSLLAARPTSVSLVTGFIRSSTLGKSALTLLCC